MSDLVSPLCRLNKLEQAAHVLDEVAEICHEDISYISLFAYYRAKMVYDLHIGNPISAKENFKKAKEKVFSDISIMHLALLCDFFSLCTEKGVSEDIYIDELLAVENLEDSENIYANTHLCSIIREYYKSVNDVPKFEKINQKYIDLLENDILTIRKQQVESLNAVETLIKDNAALGDIETKNIELKLVAEEAIRNKNALQSAYHRIEMINELGKNMTSSLDLQEVIDKIYHNLSENMPIDSFILLLVDEEKNRLRSIAYYEDDELKPPLKIDLDDKDSIFVKSYNQNSMIISNDVMNDPRLSDLKIKCVGKSNVKSAVFMPLAVSNKIIGLCSVQCSGVGVYGDEHTEFLTEILPYLSIALNNAIKSWTLEKEIQSHLKTQMKLEAANNKLEKISSLDGLTQISNRMDFEQKIIKLLKDANKEGESVAVFMLDIDNFKLYNDTYGHLEGDEALKKVAKVVRNSLEELNGISARFGGEEFIGTCVGLTKDESFALASKMCKDVYELGIEHKHAPLGKLSVSIGISFSNHIDETHKSFMMRLADMSLYKAKRTGKNRVVLQEFDINGII